MTIAETVKARYCTKVFDASRVIEPALMAQIEALLQYSPSSTNAQPWHFVVAGTPEGKARIAKATTGAYGANEAKILKASHVVVFCTRATIDDDYLRSVTAQEDADKRYASSDIREMSHKIRSFFANRHRYDLRDAQHWMEKQVYIALGTLLLGVATLGVDACPIEGFDQAVMDQELGLREKGLTSTVMVALGYRSPDDANAKLPKSRFPADIVITRI